MQKSATDCWTFKAHPSFHSKMNILLFKIPPSHPNGYDHPQGISEVCKKEAGIATMWLRSISTNSEIVSVRMGSWVALLATKTKKALL